MGIVDQRNSRLTEEILSGKLLFKSSFLTLDQVTVKLPNGKHATRDIVRHPGAVAVIAIDEQDRVLVVYQYRVALKRIMLEIPAGKLDAGEDPKDAAHRELSEETGVCAKKLTLLTSMGTSIGFCDEIIHIYQARGITTGEAHPDKDEFVESEWIPREELLAAVRSGEIQDSKTIAALLLAQP